VADAKALAVLLGGVGLRSIRTWDAAGKLPRPIKVGGRVMWRLDEIRRWLAAGAPARAEWEVRLRAEGGER
jgi:predicted DNA-binding transcriptional regulator AlpA